METIPQYSYISSIREQKTKKIEKLLCQIDRRQFIINLIKYKLYGIPYIVLLFNHQQSFNQDNYCYTYSNIVLSYVIRLLNSIIYLALSLHLQIQWCYRLVFCFLFYIYSAFYSVNCTCVSAILLTFYYLLFPIRKGCYVKFHHWEKMYSLDVILPNII